MRVATVVSIAKMLPESLPICCRFVAGMVAVLDACGGKGAIFQDLYDREHARSIAEMLAGIAGIAGVAGMVADFVDGLLVRQGAR